MAEIKFEVLADNSLTGGTSNLKVTWPRLHDMIFGGEDSRYGEYMARFRGSVLTLFGEPLYSSELNDEAFEYVLKATDMDGSSWILTIYQGATGPAIGGNSLDKSILQVASKLLELIESTPPADYEAIVYDEDSDTTVVYGCKTGRCYWSESPGRS